MSAEILTPAQQREEAQDFLNIYIAAERFLTQQVKIDTDKVWQEQLERARERIRAIRHTLAREETP